MASSTASDISTMRRLSGGLQRLAVASTRDAVLSAASSVAHELADVDGLCALPGKHSGNLFAMADDPEVRSLVNGKQLKQLAATTNTRDHVLEQRPEMQLESPAGKHFSAAAVLIVPLDLESTYVAMVFFWRVGHAPNTDQLALLPTLAWATSLALQIQEKNEQINRSDEYHRQRTLELQHRVRNVLALVRSIIRRSGYEGASAEDFASHLEARVSALARTQGWLSIDGDGGSDLEDLLRAELAANAARDTQFTIDGPALRLSARAAETMALTLHELTINALKFGALAAPTGHISIDWSIERNTTPHNLRWCWCESGVGIATPVPRRRGFGQELIERVLPYEFGARTSMTFVPGGMRCEIALPLNARTTSFDDVDNKPEEKHLYDYQTGLRE